MLEQSFPSLVSPQLWSEIGLELALNYPSLNKLKTSIDGLRASALVSLTRSSGFSEAHACDDHTKTQAVALAHTQRFCSSRPFAHIPILDSEQLSLPTRYGMQGSDRINQKRWGSFLTGVGNRGVLVFLLSFKNCDLPRQEPVRGPRPADGAGNRRPFKAQ